MTHPSEMIQSIITNGTVKFSQQELAEYLSQASICAYTDYVKNYPEIYVNWYRQSQRKEFLVAPTTDHLIMMYATAFKNSIPCSFVIHNNIPVVAAVGPWNFATIKNILSDFTHAPLFSSQDGK